MMNKREFESIVSHVKKLIKSMGDCLGQTKTVEEADELYLILVKLLGVPLAKRIWEYHVDWKYVVWHHGDSIPETTKDHPGFTRIG